MGQLAEEGDNPATPWSRTIMIKQILVEDDDKTDTRWMKMSKQKLGGGEEQH